MTSSAQLPVRAKVSAVVGTALVALLVGAAIVSSTNAGATGYKVTICHRTDSVTNPYEEITVDVAAVLTAGHGSHDGPVFDPALPPDTKWGDIVPAFDFGDGLQYWGKNLTPDGAALLESGCAPTSTTTSTEPPT